MNKDQDTRSLAEVVSQVREDVTYKPKHEKLSEKEEEALEKKKEKRRKKRQKEKAREEKREEREAIRRKIPPEIRQIIVIAIVIVLAVIGFYVYQAMSHITIKDKVTDNPYISSSMEYEGYNGFGDVAESDVPKLNEIVNFNQLYADMMGMTVDEVKEAGIFDADPNSEEYSPNTREGRQFYQYFSVERVKSEGGNGLLSNGDTVLYDLKINYSKVNGISTVKKELNDKGTIRLEYIVAGLSEPAAVIDPYLAVDHVVVDTTERNAIVVVQKDGYSEKSGTWRYSFKASETLNETGYILTDSTGTDVNSLLFTAGAYEDVDEEVTLSASPSNTDGVVPHEQYIDCGEGVLLYPLTHSYTPDVWSCLTDPSTQTADFLSDISAKALQTAQDQIGTTGTLTACYLIYKPETKTTDLNYIVKYQEDSTDKYALVTVASVKVDQNLQLVDTENYQYECVSDLISTDDILTGINTTIKEYKEEYGTDMTMTEIALS